ncbi:MAG: hypothetical protein ACTMUP_07875 [cyanobacterium endosymbiont of Rhopalodia musculus]
MMYYYQCNPVREVVGYMGGTYISHNCINLLMEAAQELLKWTSVETLVIIHQ